MRWLMLFALLSLPALIMAGPTDAHAFDSNFNVFFYPRPQCREPSFHRGNDRRDREDFYRDLERYVGCMQGYLRNAGNDIEFIKENAQKALRDYERYMKRLKDRL